MRILYFILNVCLNYTLRIFYPRMDFVNSPKEFFGSTIYVSNHPASFMDPISIASLRRPIIFFMTRSDVFTKWTKPFLWACQMLPIYRQHDGEDTKKKNEEVFEKAGKVLKGGRNLLIFGEGFTDDVFIRRLKPVKKGAARIGFKTLENLNWEKKIYICPMGVNYSSPNQMRSDYLICYQDKFCLNDYRDLYQENPNKAINDVTKRIEEGIQRSITYVEDKQLAPFHEDIMTITRKGMSATSFDKEHSLKNRFKYSQDLANWLNQKEIKEGDELDSLKDDLSSYSKLLKRFRMDDNLIHWKKKSGSKVYEIAMMILLFPFMLIGMIHCFLPYFFIKRWVEKSFRRKVFWGSVKAIAGMISIGLLNGPVIPLFYYFIYPSWWLAVAYYFSIGLTGLAAYMWFVNLKRFKVKSAVLKADTRKFERKREELKERINKLIPVA